MNKLKELYEKYKGRINKYYLAIAIFAVLTFFIGDSTLYIRYSYDKKINELEKEIARYKKEKEENEAKLNALHSDNESLERFAREQFYMTKPNEELFLIIPENE